jgi:hypothetical protein
MGEMRNGYKIFITKPGGKSSLGRPKRRWEDNIKINLREMQLKGLDWIHPAEDSDWWRDLVNTAMKLRIL